MRSVIQRVTKAKVSVNEEVVGKIDNGLMILLGIEDNDEVKDIEYMVDKVINLRIFEDEDNKMNKSVIDTGGSILAVSQFTLLGDARKGRRPSFINAAQPEKATPLYELFIKKIKEKNINIEQGIFGAEMQVELINDGPVTILLDSKRLF